MKQSKQPEIKMEPEESVLAKHMKEAVLMDDQLAKELQCSICLLTFYKPMECKSCRGVFCKSCISDVIAKKFIASCPNCNISPFEIAVLHPRLFSIMSITRAMGCPIRDCTKANQPITF